LGDHLNVQLSWGDTIYLADLPQSTASGANEIVESTGQSKCLDLLTAQINPTGKIVEAGERFALSLLNNPSRRLDIDTGNIGKSQPHSEVGIATMITIITIRIKGPDLGFVVVVETLVYPCFQFFTTELFTARIQQLQICAY
jgi:hypothetical protein